MAKKVKLVRQITVGDVVRLKSGGPKMTVVGQQGFSTAVEVIWFDTDDRIYRATVGVQALVFSKKG
jgi:uncharacterized protein YodC (DUF2158 family)